MLQQVHEVGRRARRLLWIRGLLTFFAAMVLSSVVAVLLDYALHSEAVGLRWILSGTILFSLTLVGTWILVPLVQANTSDIQIARWIERSLPDLDDRLSSAVAFLQTTDENVTAGSSSLRAALVQQVRTELNALDLPQVLDTRPVRRAAFVAAGSLLLAAGIVAWSPVDWSIGLSRLAFPWKSLRWPTVHSLAFDPLPKQIAQGADLTLRVIDQRGRLPSQVDLWYRSGDRSSDQAVRYAMQLRDQYAEWHLPRLQQSFQIRAEGGDDRNMEWINVEVVEAPELKKLQLSIVSPTYTQWPPENVPLHFQALQGSRVALQATADRPLQSASVRWQSEDGTETVIPLTLTDGNTSLALSEGDDPAWTVDATGRFYFELIDRRGIVARLPAGSVTVLRDEEPTIALRQPDDDFPAGPQTTVPLQAIISDDLTIQTIRLIYTHPAQMTGEPTSVVLFERQQAPRSRGETLQGADVLPFSTDWRLAEIPGLEPDMVISWYLQAEDIRGQNSSTMSFHWTLNRDLDLDLHFAQKQQQILKRIGKVREDQQVAIEALQRTIETSTQSRTITNAVSEELQALSLAQRNIHESLSDSPTSILDELRDQWEMIRRTGVPMPARESLHREWISCLERLDRDVLARIDSLLRRSVLTAAGDAPQQLDDNMIVRLEESRALQSELIRQLDEILSQAQRQDSVKQLTQQLAKLKEEQRVLLRDTTDLLDATLSEPLTRFDNSLQDARRAVRDRQMELARKTEQLLTYLEEVPQDTDPTIAARFAATRRLAWQAGITQQMRRAAEEINQARVANATEQQKQADAILQQMADLLSGVALTGPHDEMESDRATEQSMLPQQQIASLAIRQTEICRVTTAAWEPSAESNQPAIATSLVESLAKQQAILAADTQQIAQQVAGRKVVSWLLWQTASQMEEAAELLKAADAGQITQEKQQQARDQLQRLTELLSVEEAPTRPPGDTQSVPERGAQVPGERDRQLVPVPRLEIQLLLDCQRALNQRVEALRNRIPQTDPPESAALRELSDLAHRQGELANLLNGLIQPKDRASQDLSP